MGLRGHEGERPRGGSRERRLGPPCLEVDVATPEGSLTAQEQQREQDRADIVALLEARR